MKNFNLVKAKTFPELEEKILLLIHEAHNNGLITRTVFDGDNTGYIAFVRIFEKGVIK